MTCDRENAKWNPALPFYEKVTPPVRIGESVWLMEGLADGEWKQIQFDEATRQFEIEEVQY